MKVSKNYSTLENKIPKTTVHMTNVETNEEPSKQLKIDTETQPGKHSIRKIWKQAFWEWYKKR